MKLHQSLKNISSLELQLHSPNVVALDSNNPKAYETEAITYMIVDLKYHTDIPTINLPCVYILP